MIVQAALVSYSISIITEQRKKIVSRNIITFLTLGVIFDITATIFMILGSSRGAFTFHGLLGYSSLAGMLTDSIFLWRFYLKNPSGTQVPEKTHRYTLYAYLYWICAYITGALMVAFR